MAWTKLWKPLGVIRLCDKCSSLGKLSAGIELIHSAMVRLESRVTTFWQEWCGVEYNIYIYTLYKFLKYIYIYIMDQKRTTNTSKYWVYTSASINSFSSVMSWIVIARQCTTIWHTKARGRVIKSTVKGFQPFNTDAFLPQYPEQVVLAVPPDQHTPTFSVHTIT